MPSALPSALAACGIGVLTLDLGFAPPSATTRPRTPTCRAAPGGGTLRSEHGEPSLLIGHSAAGPPSSPRRPRCPVSAPSSPSARLRPAARRSGNVPLLVLHAPDDPVVPAREAARVFAAARHPNSFIALDGVDHDISEPRHARRVAGLIAAWAEPYLPDHAPSPPSDPTGSVVVTDAGTGRYTQTITAGRHLLTADEPVSVGGADAGPNPYELLLAALGACTVDDDPDVRRPQRPAAASHDLSGSCHDRVHAQDCTQCERTAGS